MRQRRHGRALRVALLGACVLAACGPRDGVYDPSAFRIHGTVAPPDVAVPTNVGNNPTDFDGLYLEGADSFSCCWIAPHATLLVRKRGPASNLVAGFRLPNVPRFASGQSVAIAFAHQSAAPYRERLQAGEQLRIAVPVPGALRRASGLVPVDITTSVDYLPSRDTPPPHSLFSLLGLRPAAPNGDARHLGVILLYLYFDSN
jgi:hypothetical protein